VLAIPLPTGRGTDPNAQAQSDLSGAQHCKDIGKRNIGVHNPSHKVS
jgi:hypothetical protein